MAEMTPFRYVDFYDFPRCITLHYKERLFLLQSGFDEGLDDYAVEYSIYLLTESTENSLRWGSWEFLNSTPMACIGQVQVADVVFDPSKRIELDASFLDNMIGGLAQF